jgi:hypothetical protein
MKQGKHQGGFAERVPGKAVPDARERVQPVPAEIMGAWASELGLEQASFARHLLMYYEPELYRLPFGAESK